MLEINVLGDLSVHRNGEPVSLPASRKTRALLAYLVLTGRPHRRDRLCEVFFEIPDDPRAALRWSLTKLRPVVNDGDVTRMVADRERVAVDVSDIKVDLARLSSDCERPTQSLSELQALVDALEEPLLAGIDMPDQPLFVRWLEGERAQARKTAAAAVARLCRHPELPAEQTLAWSERWLELAPFSPEAAAHRLATLRQHGLTAEAQTEEDALKQRFRNAGVPLALDKPPPKSAAPDASTETRRLLMHQRIRFCTASDNARIAYATVGDGPPIIKAANWLSHLELDWDAPIWSPLFRQLARHHRVVRYDERGNGLSDWEVDDISFDAFVTDLESVVDALDIDRFALLGISQGASVSIEYAVRYPERVSHLVLFGGYPAGWRIDADEQLIREREAIMTLTETGWGRNNPAYRQIFSSTFMPSATPDELAWFNEFQRQTTSPENAVRFLSAFGDIDVRDRLAEVRVPTLVLHARGDRRIPLEVGRDLAARIPDAEFVQLDSDGHLLLGREPASDAFVEAVRRFLAR
ncbi:MAG: alpha/beta fold hydrolase [Pseudomonadota bacterium]